MKNLLSNREWLSLSLIVTLALASILPSVHYLTYGFVPDYWLIESGLYETIGATACLIAGTFNLVNFQKSLSQKRSLGAFWLLLLSVTCLFIAGEEVSWGQHFLNYEVPSSITSTNFQREFNLHNSMLIQSSNNSLSSVFFKLLMLYFIVFPMLLVVFPTLKKVVRQVMIPMPSMLIAIIALLAKSGDIVNHKIIYGSSFKSDSLHLGEALESIFELCLLILALESFYYIKNLGSRTQQN
jgi:hypothetical protein